MKSKRTALRWVVCLFTVLSLNAAFLDCPVQANAKGCMAADIRLYDAGSGKEIENGSIYDNLKGELYENGRLLTVVSPFDLEEASKFHYTRMILGEDHEHVFADRVKLKLGNQYRFKLIVPQGYVLDRFYISDWMPYTLPEGYNISGDSVIFTYDKEIQEQVQRGGLGGGFNADYYLKNTSAANGPLTTKIKLAKTDYKLEYGAKTFNLNAEVVNGSALTYKSDDTSVISVDTKGKILVKGPGKATVAISSKATKRYGGQTKKVTFTVSPKKVASVRAISPGKRKLKVRWEKVSCASGYKIQYSYNKDMRGYKMVTVSKSAALSKTIGGFVSGK